MQLTLPILQTPNKKNHGYYTKLFTYIQGHNRNITKIS